MSQNGSLAGNKGKVLRALLTCGTIREAAQQAGVNPRTVHRYLNDEGFKRQLRERQAQTLRAVTSSLVGGAEAAVASLRGILEDDEASPSVRLRAAVALLEQMRRVTEFTDVLERLERLERVVMYGD